VVQHRVLICSNVYPPNFVGGAELVAHQYAKCLAQFGYRVLVFAGETRSARPRHAIWRDSHEGIPIVRTSLIGEDFRPEFVSFSHPDLDADFVALLDEFRPTVVHCHNLVGLSGGVIHSARARAVPIVVTLHDHWGFCHRNTLMKRPGEICQDYRRCHECLPLVSDGDDRRIPIRARNDFLAVELGAAGLLVSPSRYLADRYLAAGFPLERMSIIPYGIDVARFARLRERRAPPRVRFAFVGHFGIHKGLRIMTEALTHLRDMRGRFELSLVGEGELFSEVQQHVSTHGWDPWVRLPGKIDHARIERVYRDTDVFLLPSIWPENQPVSITEAMAGGIPVIGSRIGGIPELVEDERTGFLVEPGDPRHLAARMRSFIENPNMVRQYGTQAAERMTENTVERRVAEYVTKYDALGSAAAVDPYSTGGPLVVCVGKHFNDASAGAMASLAPMAVEPRFVMRQWIDNVLLARAALVWVVDEDVDVLHVVAMAAHGIPLLVPAACTELRRLCVDFNCGLYYGNEREAIACLEFLMANRRTREGLGRNGAYHMNAGALAGPQRARHLLA
jgi:glycosyltransferase involved in cell wall biosynthesis